MATQTRQALEREYIRAFPSARRSDLADVTAAQLRADIRNATPATAPAARTASTPSASGTGNS